MYYTKEYFLELVEQYGEVFFVLGSDREYGIHGTDSFEFVEGSNSILVRVEGIRGDELLVVEFPLDSIEHHYSHREL